jgi:hypothetical protein
MTVTARRRVTSALVLLMLAPMSLYGQDAPEPDGYRAENYRTPTRMVKKSKL